MEIASLAKSFLQEMRLLGYADHTVYQAENHLNLFTEYSHQQGFRDIENLSSELLHAFQEDIAFRTNKKASRSLWSAQYRNGILTSLRLFLKWLRQKDYLAGDLGKEVWRIKEPHRLPQAVLSEEDVLKILDLPDMTTYYGYRDKVLLELLYATGARSQEVRMAKPMDFDLKQGNFFVRHGKGKRERMVPLGSGLCKLIDHYVNFVRGRMLHAKQQDYFFTGRKTELSSCQLAFIIRCYAKKAGLQKKVTAHSFRHACATHMLRNGAPIRYVQELLGHACINTTQIYTHVTITDLKKAHAKYHPREKMNRKWY